ncbi:MAG: tetratricopeptide repeat protein [bacterium]
MKTSPKKLDTALKELRRFNRQLLEEKEQAQRICFFEKSVEQLLHNCFPNLTKPEEIKIQLWKGHNYETFGDWGKALSAYQKVIDICDSEALTSYKAEAYRWIGHIQVMQNRWSEAIKSYQISLKLTQDNGDQKNKAYVYSGLAYYYFERAELTKAVSYWEKALELAERLNEIRLLAQTNNNLGAVANVQGLWEKALAYFSKSLPRFEKIGESRGLAETYHNVAMTYADAERWSEAGAHYEISYQLAKETGDVRLQATVKLNRAVLFMAIGDLYFAEALCQQALRRYLQLEDHLGQADAYKFLGMINSKKQQWDTAKSYFEKSIQTTRKFKNPLCEAETHMEFGQMWKQKGNKKLAQKQLEQALSLFTQLKVKKEIEKVKHEIAEL